MHGRAFGNKIPHAEPGRRPSGQQCRARRRTIWVGGVTTCETQPFASELIEVRRSRDRRSITAQVAVSQIIGDHEHDVGGCGSGLPSPQRRNQEGARPIAECSHRTGTQKILHVFQCLGWGDIAPHRASTGTFENSRTSGQLPVGSLRSANAGNAVSWRRHEHGPHGGWRRPFAQRDRTRRPLSALPHSNHEARSAVRRTAIPVSRTG